VHFGLKDFNAGKVEGKERKPFGQEGIVEQSDEWIRTCVFLIDRNDGEPKRRNGKVILGTEKKSSPPRYRHLSCIELSKVVVSD
jgi:hypothetical protein